MPGVDQICRAVIVIREAIPHDAARLIALFESLFSETSFMLMEPGESTQSTETLARRLEAAAQSGDAVWFVCEADERLVGVIHGRRGAARRNRHSLYLVMGVLRSAWGRGVGTSLLRTIEDWAAEKKIHRLELTVNAQNERAIALYERAGFEREGTKRHSLRVDGSYADELYMSKLIGA